MKKSDFLLVIFYILLSINSNSQNEIYAKIKIDNIGNIFVDQNLRDYRVNDTLLIHKNIDLNNEKDAYLIKNQIFRNKYSQYIKSNNKIELNIDLPRKKYGGYFFDDSVFFISVSYLGLSKENFNKRKRFDLEIDLPKNLNLFYPKKEDLSKAFFKAPSIIAGDFEEYIYDDYCVYARDEIVDKNQRIKEIVNIVKSSFVYFQDLFSNKNEFPRIIFLPFKDNSIGKNVDNLIILNEKFLTDNIMRNKKTLIHEVLHFWWGDNSIRFENPVLAEAIAEFFTLDYLKEKKEIDYLEALLNMKKNSIKGIGNYNFNFDEIPNKNIYNLYCYRLLPYLLFSESSTKKRLINFYKENRECFITSKIGIKLLNELNIPLRGEVYL